MENVRKLVEGVLAPSNAFDPHFKVASPQYIKKFLGSLITNLHPVKVGFELSSSSNIIVYNILLVVKVGKSNLEIYIK